MLYWGIFTIFGMIYFFIRALIGPSNKKHTPTAYDEFEAQMQKARIREMKRKNDK